MDVPHMAIPQPKPVHPQRGPLFRLYVIQPRIKVGTLPGLPSVKPPKAGEGRAVKGPWNKAERSEHLCRESPLLPVIRRLPLLRRTANPISTNPKSDEGVPPAGARRAGRLRLVAKKQPQKTVAGQSAKKLSLGCWTFFEQAKIRL